MSLPDQATLRRLRKRARDRFERPDKLFFDEQGLRYATPDVVAKARAERLSDHGDSVVDVACGIGIQLAMLGRTFDQAAGIERDEQRAQIARRNQKVLRSGARVVVGDALDTGLVDELGRPDVLVCDHARAPDAERRTMAGLEPDPRLVHEVWAKDARAWCYELPPMMEPGLIEHPIAGEREYTSLNGKLRRLAVYGGEAARCERSALSLPSGERLTDAAEAVEPERSERAAGIVHVVDRAVLRAGLLAQLNATLEEARLLSDHEERRTLLTSNAPAVSAFTTDYEVFADEPWDLANLRRELANLHAGKVTLRAAIDPEDYWDVRNALERDLSGSEHLYVFRLGERALIARPL